MRGPSGDGIVFHHLPWRDLDAFARLEIDARMVGRLRLAERSRRKLLLHALMQGSAKSPELFGPLPAPDAVWELLARVEAVAPGILDRLLDHPYVGSWVGYTTRLLRNGIDGVCPLWMHLGHMHAFAAAAGVRAGIDFSIPVPAWEGRVVLPSLGLARLPSPTSCAVAEVRGVAGAYVVGNEQGEVRLPDEPGSDAPGWWAVRRSRMRIGRHIFSIRLEDVDPYRGLYEPVPPQRLTAAELARWRTLLEESWCHIVEHVPDFADMMPSGLDTLVPRPPVMFRNPSASTGEAFGSALVSLPSDGASLASTLIHEYLHVVLGGILHLTRLHDDDPRERFYVAWRDDPRPLSGALQGAYAFFGVTSFWRAMARSANACTARRAAFEFAYWRSQTWRTVRSLRDDPSLTTAGRRFVAGIAARLGDWRDEPLPVPATQRAEAAALDHYAGWRVRHLRPDPAVVAKLRNSWLASDTRPPVMSEVAELPPTPVPDGTWSPARIDLVRLRLTDPEANLSETWPAVPGASEADHEYALGRYDDAARGYRNQLARSPDQPGPLVGLGLSLRARGASPAARALVHRPELVRAVHRELRVTPSGAPEVERLAAWIGQLVSG
ncbi:MAG TPA: HEXXH motif domain-containing protein [Actinophytocola sp.]|jgi:HEXXH motif-containing protein|uniref:HEXXH motif domain-containing protein n=1 Tax=Actinophytocola sp. TaxID=1872138 RepID=UPI002F92011A